ncbi:MAG: hypothetical protein ABI417_12490 [Coleofasciculaceae cyanobacterium]
MADSIHNFSNKTPDESLAETPEEMAALRSLLLGFEQSELEQLQERLKNPNVNAEDLSPLESLSMATTTRHNSIELAVLFKVIVTNTDKSRTNNS